MGQVVQLKQPVRTIGEEAYVQALRKIERQKKTIAALRAKNKELIKLLNDPFDDIAVLRRNLIRMQNEVSERLRRQRLHDELDEICTCTPERSDFLRRR